jgi:hypothetical protein
MWLVGAYCSQQHGYKTFPASQKAHLGGVVLGESIYVSAEQGHI